MVKLVDGKVSVKLVVKLEEILRKPPDINAPAWEYFYKNFVSAF